MRAVTVALAAALVGAGGALGIAKTTGWFDGTTKTVFVSQSSPAIPAKNVLPAVKPVLGNGFDPAALYAARSAGVVTIFAYFDNSAAAAVQGSGFVVSPKGYVLTNSHVIRDPLSSRGADQLYVEFADHDRIAAKIVGWDLFDDVGLIRIDPSAHALDPVPLGNSSSVQVGEPVAAIGTPFGNEGSLTVGVVSATERSIASLTSDYDLVDAIQTDTPINHGNSGGPLFDARGLVIGINAQIRNETGTRENVGFAVPIDSARRSMQQLIATGTVAYGYVGVTTEDLTPTLARHLGYAVTRGAMIDSVVPGSPAATAGLKGGTQPLQFEGSQVIKGGDVVVSIDGLPVADAADLVRIVSGRLVPGQRARFRVIRAGRAQTFDVTLGRRPTTPPASR